MEMQENNEKVIQTETKEILADYHNIYIQDRQFWSSENAPDMVADMNLTEKSAKIVHVDDSKTHTMIVFHPYSNMYAVPVTVEIHEKEPVIENEKWDHIVEASLEIQNNELEIGDGMPGSESIVLKVAPGAYRSRIHFAHLVEGGKDAEEGDDQYLVTLWPAPFNSVKVIKQWSGFYKV